MCEYGSENPNCVSCEAWLKFVQRLKRPLEAHNSLVGLTISTNHPPPPIPVTPCEIVAPIIADIKARSIV
jgi:hypothetical protein